MKSKRLGPPYDRPPIIEAVVQFSFSTALEESTYRKLVKKLSRNYNNDIVGEQIGAQVDLLNRTSNFQTNPEHRLSSNDETDILLVVPVALTWSRLAPYEGWEKFVDRVRRDWDEAHAVLGFRKLGRIGVRFINRIDIPSENGSYWHEDYLTINLSLPKPLELVNDYAWRFERRFPENALYAIVQSAISLSEIPNYGSVLLDIDAVAQENLPSKSDDIWPLLDKMRELKNNIFELSITDKARESFSG